MRGINFCGEWGEEICTVIGLPKGGFWKHGWETRKKFTQDEKLRREIFGYKFLYEIATEAIKYKIYLDVDGKPLKG